MPSTPPARPDTRRDLRLAGDELRRNAQPGGADHAPGGEAPLISEAILTLRDDEPIVIDLRDRVELGQQVESRNTAARADRDQRELAMAVRADQLLAALDLESA